MANPTPHNPHSAHPRRPSRLSRLAIAPAKALVRFYKLAISPYLPNNCKYLPTCSDYALQALERYGLFKGLYLACRRILRCHPFAKGGFDPLP